MSVSYAGFNANSLTFRCSTKIDKGLPVKIYKSDNVKVCEDEDIFHGFAVDGDSDYVSVQLSGIVTAEYTGAAPAVGMSTLVSNSLGMLKVSTTGRECLVISVDETAKTVTFLM